MTLPELEQRLRDAGFLVSLGGNTSAEGAAAVIGIGVRTLYRWHALGEGPPRIQVGPGRILYPIVGLLGWLAAREAVKSDCQAVSSTANHCQRRIS